MKNSIKECEELLEKGEQQVWVNQGNNYYLRSIAKSNLLILKELKKLNKK